MQFSCSVMSKSLRPHEPQHARPPCPSPNSGVYPNSSPLWRKLWHPTPVLLPGKSHGQRTLVGYSPWGCKDLDTTEQLHVLENIILSEKNQAEKDSYHMTSLLSGYKREMLKANIQCSGSSSGSAGRMVEWVKINCMATDEK